ncbi:MAG: hypothetical protein PHP50_11220 [Lachnospiraceae bacterium]|nr:hypothetical protein [Lachnospiraceae bacterium]
MLAEMGKELLQDYLGQKEASFFCSKECLKKLDIKENIWLLPPIELILELMSIDKRQWIEELWLIDCRNSEVSMIEQEKAMQYLEMIARKLAPQCKHIYIMSTKWKEMEWIADIYEEYGILVEQRTHLLAEKIVEASENQHYIVDFRRFERLFHLDTVLKDRYNRLVN